jgi:deoxyribonuclease V
MNSFAKIQKRISKSVCLKTKIKKLATIAGFDQAFVKDNIISAGIVCDAKNMTVIEKVVTISKASIPYIPGLLAFREGPAILATYKKLNKKPDVVLVDGHGIAHPKRAGLACYVGVKLKKPTIGIAKSLLYGHIKGNKIFIGRKQVGAIIKRSQFAPIYISPGHLVSISKSVKIVKACLKGHRLPEPLWLAHKEANYASCKN